MIVGVPKEIKNYEYRVAATPTTVQEFIRKGHTVIVEHNAGLGSGFKNEDYIAAGAEIAECDKTWERSAMIYKVKEIFPQEYKYLNKDKIIFTYIHSNAHRDQTEALLKNKVASIAYEDVMDEDGKFPLLRPMSELAGKGGFLAALHFSQAVNGGKGLLLNNVCGGATPTITIVGIGCSGLGAAELASAFGNRVNILDIDFKAMEEAKKHLPSNVSFLYSNRGNLEMCLKESDVLINCILWPKTRKDHLVYRDDLKMMKAGAMIVDVACDEKGAVETCRSTTFAKPVYYEEGIMHYCVDNIPSAFAHTASTALSHATLPYALQIADNGLNQALKHNKGLQRGLTSFHGKLTLKETAIKLGLEYTSPDEIVKLF